MACLYKRRNQFWISYYVGGRQVQESLHTDKERIAQAKKRRVEYELEIGDLHVPSKLPLPKVLAAFCRHLEVTCAPGLMQEGHEPTPGLLRPGLQGPRAQAAGTSDPRPRRQALLRQVRRPSRPGPPARTGHARDDQPVPLGACPGGRVVGANRQPHAADPAPALRLRDQAPRLPRPGPPVPEPGSGRRAPARAGPSRPQRSGSPPCSRSPGSSRPSKATAPPALRSRSTSTRVSAGLRPSG